MDRTRGGHIRFVPADKTKDIVVSSTTSSDHRAIKNLTAMLRKSGLKANGRHGAGLLLIAPTGRVLLLRRSSLVSRPGLWSVPAGRIEPNESHLEAAVRELGEEAGYRGPLCVTGRLNRTAFCCFVATVPSEFRPRLNWENDAAGWFAPTHVPMPAHPGLQGILSHLW